MHHNPLLARIDPKTTAFLVCDIQERFRSAIYGFDDLVATSRKMIKFAEVLGIGVIVTEQNSKALGKTVDELGIGKLPKSLQWGTFEKKKFSMIIPEVKAVLKDKSIASVVLFGLESHVCVLQTSLDLLRLHHPILPFLIRDGVSSCNHQEVDIAMAYIRRCGGIVTTSESILFQLMGDAALPHFKDFAALIKEEKLPTGKALNMFVRKEGKTTGAFGEDV